MKAQLRYFCLVLPNGGAQVGFSYLEALHQTGLGVKACPIGPAFLMSSPWSALMHLFFRPELDSIYVNVVAAPPNLSMGQALKTSDMRPPPGDNLPGVPPAQKEEVLYRPQTALAGLYTVGVANVAITSASPRPPDNLEIQALAQYDLVIAPTKKEADDLAALGLTTYGVPPDPARLIPLFRALLP